MFIDSLILMLHRIGQRNSSRISANQNMCIKPNELLNFIESAKKKKWSFISMDQLVDCLNVGKIPKKTIALTFDDGYSDNYLYAYPLLSSLDVPFCVYVTTSFIENNPVPWWYELECIINSVDQIISPDGTEYAVKTLEQKNQTFMELRKGFMAGKNLAREFQFWLNRQVKIQPFETESCLFMSWEEVVTIASSKLVTIGAHTLSHPVLAKLDDDQARKEILSSKHILEAKLGKKIDHFAFPFGGMEDVSPRDIEFARSIGFRSAVTTRNGGLGWEKKIDCYSLPRVFFGPNFRLDGIQLHLAKSHAKQVVKKWVGHAN